MDKWIFVLKLIAVIGYVYFMVNLLRVKFPALIQSGNDDKVQSISRFQMLFWTGLYGFTTLYHFIVHDKLLAFSENQLLLMGISGGVYLGGKWLGNQTGSKESVSKIAELEKKIVLLNEELVNTKAEQAATNNNIHQKLD